MSFVTGISRYILPLLTIIIIVKCLLTLLLGQPKDKTYGYIIDISSGKRYPLNMWETSIGRSSSCDIVVSYATISRYQAVISRRIDGWYIYDLNSKSGTIVNGRKIEKKATIHAGNEINFGGIRYRFEIIDDPVQRVGKHKKSKKAPPKVAARPSGKRSFDDDCDEDFFEDEAPSKAYYRFYDSNNRPELNFKKNTHQPNPVPKRSHNGNVYSGSGHIQTPSRANSGTGRPFSLSRPSITNKDTDVTYILSGNLVSIGRSRSCDIGVTSPTASRKHALLILYEDGWAITDAGSSSGTFLNGKKVTEPQLLFRGDVISVGDDRLFFNS